MSLNEHLARKRAELRAETNTAETEMKSAPASVPDGHGGQQPGVTLCASDKPVKSVLSLRCWNREVWVFPWPCFTEAHFAPGIASGADTLRLAFGNREITLRGRNLAGLMDAVACHILCEVRETLEAHITPADAESGAPVVWEIRVGDSERAK